MNLQTVFWGIVLQVQKEQTELDCLETERVGTDPPF